MYYKVTCDQESRTDYTNYAMSSYICAYGRLHLMELAEDLEKDGQLAVYSDTDSVYFQRRNPTSEWFAEKHLHETELGKAKFEKKTPHTGIFLAPKLYALREQTIDPKLGRCKTFIKGRGIPVWAVVDDNPLYANRQEANRIRRE